MGRLSSLFCPGAFSVSVPIVLGWSREDLFQLSATARVRKKHCTTLSSQSLELQQLQDFSSSVSVVEALGYERDKAYWCGNGAPCSVVKRTESWCRRHILKQGWEELSRWYCCANHKAVHPFSFSAMHVGLCRQGQRARMQ